MNKSQRLKALLERGYFPAELPPPFNTRDIARFRNAILAEWSVLGQTPPKTLPTGYSIPKVGRVRRQLSIVNPISQLGLSKLIADEWVTIRRHLRKFSYSVDSIDIGPAPGRAVPSPDFLSVAKRSSDITASYDYSLSSDISRFYATLYTHTIPWALHGKVWCKSNMNTPAFKASLGDQLDTAVRKGQDNQTIGVPVGPDTSRIISEIVGSAIDGIVEGAQHFGRDRAYRNVDDWEIGFDSAGAAEEAISALSEACRAFELELHPEKTKITHLESRRDTLWAISLRQKDLGGGIFDQSRAIELFFTEAFEHASQHPNQNVLEFALKRTLGATIHSQNWQKFETYLLRAVRFSPALLPTATAILTKYYKKKHPIGNQRISKLVNDCIRKAAPLGHYSEIAWSLFICKALDLNLSKEACRQVERVGNPVCALLALDLEHLGLTDSVLDKTLWQSSLTTNGLTSSDWLLAYESTLKGWLTGNPANFAATHPYFGPLLNRGVSFYDSAMSVYMLGPRGPLPNLEEQEQAEMNWFDEIDDLNTASDWYY